MAFTDITSTASVRAILGVSEKELRDDVLLDPIYAVRLSEELLALNEDIFADFTVAAAADPRTAEQLRFVDLTQTYSAYALAKQCLGAVPMFAPVTIQDSKTQVTRATDPYKNLRADIDASLTFLRGVLLAAYSAINSSVVLPTRVTRTLVLAAPLATNPVTG